MNSDLKIIKKYYGEKMMRLCRELFSTILDNSPGALPKILLDNFAPNHYLYNDLATTYSAVSFKNYIYSIYKKLNTQKNVVKEAIADPITLLKQAGYTLYECTTEEDIQQFRKYYTPGERLCTFDGGRLNRCYVYFAVKDGAETLNRQDFANPNRQDEYGTSVISIQFTRDATHTLSIKNRYNHTVPNPDATFSNDLDNIIPGLTRSFAEHYGMAQKNIQDNYFEMFGYVRANDGRFYPYNYEINNVYYCPQNIIIDNFQVTRYDKDKYLIMDYFILDLVHKKIINKVDDSLSESIGEIKKIKIENTQEGKIVIITPMSGEDVIIKLDKFQNIASIKNNNVLSIANNFLIHNTELINITLDNVISIQSNFLRNNHIISEISLPKVETIGDNFLQHGNLTNISLPNVKIIGSHFLEVNYGITSIDFPELISIGDDFLAHNWSVKNVVLPNLKTIGKNSLRNMSLLANLYVPKLKEYGMTNDRLKILIRCHDDYKTNADKRIKYMKGY